MKKLILAALVFSALALTACGPGTGTGDDGGSDGDGGSETDAG